MINPRFFIKTLEEPFEAFMQTNTHIVYYKDKDRMGRCVKFAYSYLDAKLAVGDIDFYSKNDLAAHIAYYFATPRWYTGSYNSTDFKAANARYNSLLTIKY